MKSAIDLLSANKVLGKVSFSLLVSRVCFEGTQRNQLVYLVSYQVETLDG